MELAREEAWQARLENGIAAMSVSPPYLPLSSLFF